MKTAKRKICVVTGSRAEYGLMKPLIEAIKSDRALDLQLVATGMHLSSEFGLTYREIERDGFTIDEKVNISLKSDTSVGVAKSMGLALSEFAQTFEKLVPDMIVVMGDRFEIFSAVSAALVSRIPVAHLSGGELTEGAIDDAFRHSITKMSHLHFVSTEEYRKRVIRLGEDPKRVFNVGEIGLDNFKNIKLLSKKELEKDLNFGFSKNNLLVTYHPETIEKNGTPKKLKNLFEVLDSLEDTHVVFTKANADMGGRGINKMIDDYTLSHSNTAIAVKSLGHLRYLSVLKLANAVVGNSSSGIVEAASFKTPTINIGDRQKGRIKPKNVVDCQLTKPSLKSAFKKVESKSFKNSLKNVTNPYGDGKSAHRIIKILKDVNLKTLLRKRFYDGANK